MNKIAFCGFAGSGKSLLSQMLGEISDYKKSSFANGIRDCFSAVLAPAIKRPLDKSKDRSIMRYIGKYMREPTYIDYAIEKEFAKANGIKSDEKIMQMWAGVDTWANPQYITLGYIPSIEQYEQLDDMVTLDFWAKYELAKMKNHAMIAIDDLRYQWEFDNLKEQGYSIIKLNCSREICEQRLIVRDGGFEADLWTHPSELDFLKFKVDYEIDATQPIESVLRECQAIINKNRSK